MTDPAYLPVLSGQWSEVLPGSFSRLKRGRMDIYSYGDSAGFAPDFPFNGALRQPKICTNILINGINIVNLYNLILCIKKTINPPKSNL